MMIVIVVVVIEQWWVSVLYYRWYTYRTESVSFVRYCSGDAFGGGGGGGGSW